MLSRAAKMSAKHFCRNLSDHKDCGMRNFVGRDLESGFLHRTEPDSNPDRFFLAHKKQKH